MSARELGEILDLLETGECPRESKPALTKILRGDAPDLKLRALEFTADLIDDDRFARLHIDLVEDDRERTDVRARAAVVLGPTLELCDYAAWETQSWDSGFERPPISQSCFREIQERLERVYRTAEAPKLVRRRVLESAVRAPQDWQRGAVRAAWNGDDPEWRRTAVFAMGRLAGFEETLEAALEADDGTIVCEAMRAAAGNASVDGITETCLAYARDDDAPLDCRLAAIEGLRFADSPEVFNLLELLTDSSDDDIAGTAAWALDEWHIYNGEY